MYGFVRPNTGESEFWLLPTVNGAAFPSGKGLEAFSEVLRGFARLRVEAVVANGRVDSEAASRSEYLEELWERVEARCAYLQTQADLIRGH